MSNEPSEVSYEQLKEALGVMGLDQDLSNLMSITIEPGVVTVVRKRANAMGKNFIVAYDRVATETTEVRLGHKGEVAR